MNFTVSKSELNNALQTVSHAVSQNSPQAPLRGIKIEAKDGILILTGSDSDISIRKELRNDPEKPVLNIIEDGAALIETKYLLDIVRKIDSEEIRIEIIDGTLTKLSGNHAEFKINGMKPENYPNIDFSKPNKEFVLNQGLFKEIIAQTNFATSQKEAKPVLTGVNFIIRDGKLECTATDSYRLAKKVLPYNGEIECNITIPSRTLNEINSIILTDETKYISVYLNDRKVLFITDDILFQSKLLDGVYPDTNNLIPREFTRVLKISRHDLISAIDRTTFIKNDNMTVDRLECSQDELVLTNRNQEIGESREVLIGEFTGEPLDISFSGPYLMSAAKALKGNEVLIQFTGEMRPFILADPNDDSIMQLVLPVRTYN